MNKILSHIVLFFLITGINSISAAPEKNEKIHILSTIKPVHLIVSAIAGDNAKLTQLIPDNASVHDYSFGPSDIRKVKNANIVFRIDEHLEEMLTAVLKQNILPDYLISLAEEDGIEYLNLSDNDLHSHGHANEHNTKDKHDSHKKNIDLHIWSSPKNSIVMARSIALRLSKLDNKNSEKYLNNFKIFEADVLNIAKKIQEELSTVTHKPYIVFHNSWQYFAQYFGLSKPEIVSFQSALGGDIKSILMAREKIKRDQISCVISDPTISQARIQTLTEGFNKVKTTQVDVLASNVAILHSDTESAYITWLKGLATKIKTCLSDSD